MDSDTMVDWNADEGQLSFTVGREVPFTKTPANVPANYTKIQDDYDDEASSPLAKTKQTTSKKKRKASPPTPNIPPKKAKSRAATTRGAKRMRKTSNKNPISSRPIPRTREECSAVDNALLAAREAGEGWKTIRATWEAMTGERTANSTLPNRYERLMTSFTAIRPDDHVRLLVAKREVEENFEAQKWMLVRATLEVNGGDTYEEIVLKRQYKKLMLAENTQPPPGVRDADFNVAGDEDQGSVDPDAGSDAMIDYEG